jgi:hypothetical protein
MLSERVAVNVLPNRPGLPSNAILKVEEHMEARSTVLEKERPAVRSSTMLYAMSTRFIATVL